MTTVHIYVAVVVLAICFAQGCFWAEKMGPWGLIPSLLVGWCLGGLIPFIGNLLSNG